MTLQELVTLAGERDLAKSYPKADGNYIWDYKLQVNQELGLDLVLIPSNTGKAGYKDKVSVEELVNYVLDEHETDMPVNDILAGIEIVEVEGVTVAKV